MRLYYIFTIAALAYQLSCPAYSIANPNATIQNTEIKNHISLSDSLNELLSADECDTIVLQEVIKCIRKNRKKLKSDYLRLLYSYKEKSEALNYKTGLMKSLDHIGLQYRYGEKYDSAIYYHNRSLTIAKALNDSAQLYYNYNNLAQAYRMQDLSVQAISYFQQSLKIAEAIGNERSASHTMNSLGASYVIQKEYEQALYFFKASSDIARKRNDKRTLAYNYGSMGEVFLLQQQNDSAMHYFVLSKQLLEALGGSRGLGVANHLIAQANFALGNYTEAERYFNTAIALHKTDKNKRYLSLCYGYMAQLEIKQKDLDTALSYINMGLPIAIEIHSYENIIIFYDASFELYKIKNQWEKAVNALQLKQQYSDSLINLAKGKEIQSLKIAFDIDRKENQIKLLSAENEIKSQRFSLSLAIIFALIMSVIAGIYFQVMRKKKAHFIQDKLKQQLMLSQMNPHFIFNALGSIQSFMYKNEAKKAAGFMGNFASLTRSILNNCTAEKIPLDEEINTLKNYLTLEQMRMQSSFEFKIIMDEEVDAEMINIPPMMLQPFIENAIKHGIKKIEHKGLINITIEELYKENLLKINITDNGVGINNTKKQPKQHQSKATDIFSKRMLILQKTYRNIPPLEITDRAAVNEQGTNVLLYLPIMDE